jgi:serine O-acetyltransferase
MFQRLREDINSVFARDPAARNFFEVLTNYPGLHALLAHRFNHWLWQKNFKWLARTLSTLTRWLTGIEIHPGAKIGRRFFIDHGMGVVIGETAEIGDDVTLYHGVTLGGTSWRKGKRHPTLEDGVIVGAGAKILGPFTVGAGAKIGSNAVVTKEVPPGATVVGIPGKIVHRPDPDSEEALAVDPERREAMRQKFGFDAYGISEDMPDPVARSIQAMLDHMHAVDERIERMCHTLRKLDASYRDGRLPELRDEDFADILDDVESGCGPPKPPAAQPPRHDAPAEQTPRHDHESGSEQGKG